MSERTVPDEYGSKFYKNSAHGGGSAARAAVGTVTPTLLVVGVPCHIARVPPSIDHPAGDQRQANDGKRDPPKHPLPPQDSNDSTPFRGKGL